MPLQLNTLFLPSQNSKLQVHVTAQTQQPSLAFKMTTFLKDRVGQNPRSPRPLADFDFNLLSAKAPLEYVAQFFADCVMFVRFARDNAWFVNQMVDLVNSGDGWFDMGAESGGILEFGNNCRGWAEFAPPTYQTGITHLTGQVALQQVQAPHGTAAALAAGVAQVQVTAPMPTKLMVSLYVNNPWLDMSHTCRYYYAVADALHTATLPLTHSYQTY
ncbi:hypothetical protein HDU98_001462 [Podochytrium sp. JEL0797]|nr:hypothetical protein HDU98_001462 [Podochytrium sp. JEL0797]